MEKLKLALISESAANWPVYAGLHKGLFAQQGIKVDLEITRSSVKQMEALTKGDLYDIGHQAADHIVRAVEQGSDLFIFMGLTTPNYSLITSSNVRTYEDLKGRVLAVDGLNTGFALLLRGLLSKNGLVYERDYQLKQIGGTGERLEALLRNEVAGAFLDGPADLIAEEQGLRRLGSNLDYLSDYQGTVAACRRQWADSNREKLRSYIKGYVESSRWLINPENCAEAVEILGGYLKLEKEIGYKTYDRYLSMRTFNSDARLNTRGLEEVIKVMASTGQLARMSTPSKYYDLFDYEQALAEFTNAL